MRAHWPITHPIGFSISRPILETVDKNPSHCPGKLEKGSHTCIEIIMYRMTIHNDVIVVESGALVHAHERPSTAQMW
jgi:hypothetical protein